MTPGESAEIPRQSSEGAERIASGNTFLYEFSKDFNFNNAVFEAHPIGDFSVMFLEPSTGEVLDPQELGAAIRRTGLVRVYAPSIRLGQFIHITNRTRKHGSDSYSAMLVQRTEDGWIFPNLAASELLLFTNKDTSGPSNIFHLE